MAVKEGMVLIFTWIFFLSTDWCFYRHDALIGWWWENNKKVNFHLHVVRLPFFVWIEQTSKLLPGQVCCLAYLPRLWLGDKTNLDLGFIYYFIRSNWKYHCEDGSSYLSTRQRTGADKQGKKSIIRLVHSGLLIRGF